MNRRSALKRQIKYIRGQQILDIEALNDAIDALMPLNSSQTYHSANASAEYLRLMYSRANSIAAYQSQIDHFERELTRIEAAHE